MKALSLSFLILISLHLHANATTLLAKKGAKIASLYCNEKALHAAQFHNMLDAKKKIVEEKMCEKLSPKQLDAVAAYALSKKRPEKQPEHIEVPKNAKCPICGMFVARYPKWAALLQDEKGHKLYFDGVKDMMKYYFNHPKARFDPIIVSDFYTLKAIDGKKAWYVIGSNVYGPMGEELIPFQKREDAQLFKKEHFGKKIVTFDQIREAYLY